MLESINKIPAALKAQAKRAGFSRTAAYTKALNEKGDAAAESLLEYISILEEAQWLTAKFGTDGEYKDIPGLCKIADISEVEGKNWSLTPGAYVGVAEAEDDGVDFAERMHEIHTELLTLQQESNELMEKISANFKELEI